MAARSDYERFARGPRFGTLLRDFVTEFADLPLPQRKLIASGEHGSVFRVCASERGEDCAAAKFGQLMRADGRTDPKARGRGVEIGSTGIYVPMKGIDRAEMDMLVLVDLVGDATPHLTRGLRFAGRPDECRLGARGPQVTCGYAYTMDLVDGTPLITALSFLSQRHVGFAVFQIVWTLAVCQAKLRGFRHNDLHRRNVLVREARTNRPMVYEFPDGSKATIPAGSPSVVIIDYGRCNSMDPRMRNPTLRRPLNMVEWDLNEPHFDLLSILQDMRTDLKSPGDSRRKRWEAVVKQVQDAAKRSVDLSVVGDSFPDADQCDAWRRNALPCIDIVKNLAQKLGILHTEEDYSLPRNAETYVFPRSPEALANARFANKVLDGQALLHAEALLESGTPREDLPKARGTYAFEAGMYLDPRAADLPPRMGVVNREGVWYPKETVWPTPDDLERRRDLVRRYLERLRARRPE